MTDIVENDPEGLSDLAGVREYNPEVKAKPRICSARGPRTPSVHPAVHPAVGSINASE